MSFAARRNQPWIAFSSKIFTRVVSLNVVPGKPRIAFSSKAERALSFIETRFMHAVRGHERESYQLRLSSRKESEAVSGDAAQKNGQLPFFQSSLYCRVNFEKKVAADSVVVPNTLAQPPGVVLGTTLSCGPSVFPPHNPATITGSVLNVGLIEASATGLTY
jgi:hypothetical protein